MAIQIETSKIVIIPNESETDLGIVVHPNPGAIITIDGVPDIGEIRKADGTVLANGDTITEAELAELVYAASGNDFGASAFSYTISGGGMNASTTVNVTAYNANPAGYFVADDGVSGRELHRINADGTTELILDINAGSGDSYPFFKPYWMGSSI